MIIHIPVIHWDIMIREPIDDNDPGRLGGRYLFGKVIHQTIDGKVSGIRTESM